MADTATTELSTARRRGVTALVILATVVGLFAVFAVWANRQLLDTNSYANTSTDLLKQAVIRQALADFLTDELYANVNVKAELGRVLPKDVKPLAGPASSGLRELVNKAANEALGRSQIQDLWKQANINAHRTLLAIVEDRSGVVTSKKGTVTLDLAGLVKQVGAQAGIDVGNKIPPDVGRIQVLKSNDLGLVQDLIKLLRGLALVLPAIALGLYALAIYLATGRRRETLRAAGIGLLVIGVLVLIGRKVGGNVVVDTLVTADSVKPAAHSAWDVLTSLLRDSGYAMAVYGILILLGAWLAGTGSAATEARRGMTPFLRERQVSYILLAIVFVILLLWAPAETFKHVVPALTFFALMIVGAEALRAQSLREFPDETRDVLKDRIAQRVSSIRGPGAKARGAPAPGPEDARLAALERLAKLKDTGVLDDDEFQREKQRILTG